MGYPGARSWNRRRTRAASARATSTTSRSGPCGRCRTASNGRRALPRRPGGGGGGGGAASSWASGAAARQHDVAAPTLSYFDRSPRYPRQGDATTWPQTLLREALHIAGVRRKIVSRRTSCSGPTTTTTTTTTSTTVGEEQSAGRSHLRSRRSRRRRRSSAAARAATRRAARAHHALPRAADGPWRSTTRAEWWPAGAWQRADERRRRLGPGFNIATGRFKIEIETKTAALERTSRSSPEAPNIRFMDGSGDNMSDEEGVAALRGVWEDGGEG